MQVRRVERLESDEQAAQPRIDGLLEQIGREHGVDGAGGLPQAAHAAHAVEERRGEAAIAEQVIVEKVEMPARQPLDLRERGVDGLRVERPAAFEERLLVAEVADVRAAARHDDRVRHQIETPLDQIAADRRQAGERASLRSIHALGMAAAEVGEESRPRVLAGPEEDRVGVRGRLVRQRRDVQAAERHVRAARAVVIGECDTRGTPR